LEVEQVYCASICGVGYIATQPENPHIIFNKQAVWAQVGFGFAKLQHFCHLRQPTFIPLAVLESSCRFFG
ncbi:MAG: hypothetical protein Q4A06_09340, partial [Cardiobacteriaceae bacterium]|nr:hypothetical protein [Cardiobacteriaceae bacterium]